MTPPLRDAFERLLVDEPPLELTVDEVVRRGRQRQGRRRRGVGLAAAAALVIGLGVAANLAASTDDSPAASSTSVPATTPTTAATTGSTATTATTASTTTTAPPPPPEEQLPDPGFEAATLGWSTFGPATTLTPVTTARSGDHALEISSTVTVDDVAGATNRPVQVTTVAREHYQATCWVRSTQVITAHVQVQEYTREWARAGDPAASDRVTLADPGRWYQVRVEYTAQASGNQLPLTVFSTKLRPGGPTLLVDDCSLVIG
jgi:hypothetical protein